MINSVNTSSRRVKKSPSKSFGVKSIFEIHSYILSYRISFNSFVALLIICDRFNEFGVYSSTTGVFDRMYDKRNGASKRVLVGCIERLISKGLVMADKSGVFNKLYPTDKALREVSKFL